VSAATKSPGSRAALLAYTALSLVLTWPLALGLGRDVPGDLGDSLLNMWILAWGAEHVPRLLTGGISWADFWNANIFHPEPLGLTFSEHLFGQTLQVLPVYWLTGNIILCYNLLFISTFALSAFGAFLLARELTGDWRAALVAGLVYGFLPYRIVSIPHLQVISSQWMPFALYGLSRFVTTGSTRALVSGTAALVMQNWSCGYYLLYFAPFVPLFVIHRMWTSAKLADAGTWASLAAAAAATMLLTLPFLWPYADAQQRFGLERSLAEVVQFSANVWSYATAGEDVRLWGRVLRFYPRPEGETFLGFMPWILATVALLAALGSDPSPNSLSGSDPRTPTRRLFIILLTIAVVTQFIAAMSAVIFGGFDFTVLGIPIRARTPSRLFVQFLVSAAILMAVSPGTRANAARLARTPMIFFAVATILAVWLSLGPAPRAGDAQVSGFGLYQLLYDYVPGFNGLRVPARFAMIAGLFLSVASAFGVTVLLRGQTPRKLVLGVRPLTLVISLLILLEGAAVPLAVNRTWAQDEAMPPARVHPASAAPAVYQRAAALPAGTVITEFPFGDGAWEIRYTYYAHVHWKPITNGYSGGFPPTYRAMVARLQNVTANPEEAWRALVDSGTTHVILHPAAFRDPAAAAAVESWLQSHGARLVESFEDRDALYAIP
jgi:hypothetical protein